MRRQPGGCDWRRFGRTGGVVRAMEEAGNRDIPTPSAAETKRFAAPYGLVPIF